MITNRILRVLVLLLLGSLIVAPCAALEVVGSVGGSCPSVAARDGYVYLCEGRGLTVLDARAAGDPVVIERVRLDAGTTCVRLDNDVAYVGTVDGKVRIYSLADAASPTLLSTFTLVGGSLTDAAFEGNHAFFANEGGVEIVDVSDPAAPVAVSRYEMSYMDPQVEKRRVCVRAGTMYVSDRAGCEVVDVAQPELLAFRTRLSSLAGFPDGVASIRYSDNGLYVLWRGWHFGGGFLPAWDVTVALYRESTPGEPMLHAWSSVEDSSDMLLSEDQSAAYVLGRGWRHHAAVYDIIDPSEFRLVDSCELPDTAFEGALDGSSLLSAGSGGLTRVNISPNDPMSIVGRYFKLGNTRCSSVGAGGCCFTATDQALLLAGIDTPSHPSPLYSGASRTQFISAATSGRFLYLSSPSEGLDVRYITPEPKIAKVATLDPLAWENLEKPKYGGLAISGETVWLAYSAGKAGDWTIGLLGFDTSHPVRPTAMSRIARGSSAQSMPNARVAVSRGRACLAADKLYFFDITDPISPKFMSELPAGSISGTGLASWTDDVVLLMGTGSRLLMVDASDTANPVLLASSSPLPSGSSLMWVENGRAYLGTYRVLYIYRVVPGGDPILLESIASRGYIGSVEVYGGHVYAMDSEDGLLVMKTNFPDHLAQRHLLGSDTGAADQNGDGVIDAADLVLAMAAARE